MLITRKVEFSSSHVCHNSRLSDEENLALYGDGANPAGHGHNFVAEITLDGEPDPVTGMVMDLKDLQEILDAEIMQRFDHRDLNADTPFFDKLPPTPENLLMAIHRQLTAVLPDGLLASIRLEEDAETFVEWIEDGAST